MIDTKRVHRSVGGAALMIGFLLLSACDDGSGLPSQFSVNGTVANLAAGESMVLNDNGADGLTISTNGEFTFATLINLNGSYHVTVATQPKGQVCTVSNGSGTDLVVNVINVQVTCSTANYTISGAVSGLASGAKLVLEDNGADTLTLSANGPFSFAAPIDYNGAYAVTVASQPTGETCTVSKGSGAGVTAAVTNVAVACSTDTYPVSGSLSGLPGGEQLVLQNNGADALRLSANGHFTFTTPVAYDGSYAVTVSTQPTEATCSVTHGVGAGVTAAVSGVSVLCSLDAYTISGTVSGLASGSQVTIDDNGADPLTLTANGAFTFAAPVAAGGSYAVTVGTQPTGATCTVSSGQGSQLGSNVSGVTVTCSTNTFTIGGTLSGLASATQVTLDDNGADPLTLTSDGAFTFATPVAYGGAYNVTVGTPPSGQQCAVANGSSPSVASNVTNVSVTCTVSTVSYTTPGTYNWTVPAGVTSVQIVATGGGGGGGGLSGTNPGQSGGAGALVTSTLSVTPGQVLALVVGGGGGAGTNGPAGSGGGYTCGAGGGGGGASSIDAGNAGQIIAGGGGAGGSCDSSAGGGGSGGGAGGAGGSAGSDGMTTGGSGGSGGIGGAGGGFMYGGPSGIAGGNGSGGPGGGGGSNGGGAYPGGTGGSGVGSGAGGNDTNNDLAGGGGGGYGGGGAGADGTSGGAGGSIGPSGTTYAAASNAGASATGGGTGSITITLQ
jgi:hypothetical protein